MTSNEPIRPQRSSGQINKSVIPILNADSVKKKSKLEGGSEMDLDDEYLDKIFCKNLDSLKV